MTDLFLGVDGGGTKTEFVCIDAAGNERARTTVGTTYHPEIGLDETVRRIGDGVAAVSGMLGIAPSAFRHVFLGLPAYGEDQVIDPLLHAACGATLGHHRYDCGNDMVCGWAGSLACADGINIVAGTGSIGYGERHGRMARVGGWGEVFGDEGSAHWIAIQGLAAFSRMSDGRVPRGPLHDLVRDELALSTDLELCERILGKDAMTRREIAGLAPLVTRAALAGDQCAATILDRAADELVAHATALRSRLGFEQGERTLISWSGSILTKVEAVQQRFATSLRATGDFEHVAPRYPPAYGAALYARLKSGVAPTA